jgi:argininosuccinate lyase
METTVQQSPAQQVMGALAQAHTSLHHTGMEVQRAHTLAAATPQGVVAQITLKQLLEQIAQVEQEMRSIEKQWQAAQA